MKAQEQILSKKVVYEGRILKVRQDTVQIHSGETREFTIVEHPGAVVVLPIMDDGTLVMVRQWRRAPGKELLEFPAGTLEKNEDPFDCAKRELIEETCFEGREWFPLGTQLPAPGFCDEVQHCYLARGLSAHPGELDEDEIIEVERVTKEEFLARAAQGDGVDAKSLAIYLLAVAKGLI